MTGANPRDRTRVAWESEHITFRSLWHAATVLRQAGEQDDAHGFWSLLAAALLVHAAYEGFLNDLLERVDPDTWAEERTFFTGDRSGVLGKTRFLAERLSVDITRGSGPYSTVALLNRWRHDLVHPRTFRDGGIASAETFAKYPKRATPEAFEKLEQPFFLPRCFDDISSLADRLLAAAKQAHPARVRALGDSAFWGPVGSGGATLREDGAG